MADSVKRALGAKGPSERCRPAEKTRRHPTIADYEGIRTERYKYARYIEQDPLYEEVYDLEADPHEQYNLVDKPQYSQLVRQLRKRNDELRAQVGGVWIPWPDDELLTRNRKRR